MTADVLWTPSPERIAAANLTAFLQHSGERFAHHAKTYADLHAWSIAKPEEFWPSVIAFAGLKAETWGTPVLVDGDRMPGARFFPDAKLNFAENLLSRCDNTPALVFWGEDKVKRRLSWNELYARVADVASALRAHGVVMGDRVAGYLPNMPEAVIAMLATASIGATWSSCSPDFGVDGVIDRFGQIAPKVLIAADGYYYNGKAHDCLNKLSELSKRLESVVGVVVVGYISSDPDIGGIARAQSWSAFAPEGSGQSLAFEQVPFNHPLYVMFSSGTTGVPKCIVHGTGGTLLKQVCELNLHCDIKPADRVFYFTTCSWMMWNWLVAALAVGATVILYDGSPFYPNGNVLFDLADAEGVTLFGTSAKYIDALNKAAIEPKRTHRLGHIKTITSTGSPLAPEAFDYVYRSIKTDCHLASISGGTDILGCFVIGNPTSAVRRGEIQARALGMAVDVFDDCGNSVRQTKGELVCTKPFPSMPIGFWNDTDGRRYSAAYFETYANIWHHGDFAEITDSDGFVIHGRSDTTLNPGGVRIGTAEIYRQVEKLPQVKESLVIAQEWDGDVRIVLFVVLSSGCAFDQTLVDRIKHEIRTNCTQRHVPAKVVHVGDIPRTKSGKITEMAVRDIIHGRVVKNSHVLANPEALDHFRNLEELET